MTTKLHIMQEFAEHLKANPIECIKFFQNANILDSNGNLLPQYKKSSNSSMNESRKSFNTMTSDELRKAAAFCAAAHTTDSPLANISNYLNTCADALENGPVVQVVDVMFDGAQKPAYKALKVLTENEMPDGQLLYPLAMPAQAQPSLTRELQQRCSDWGVYWRASDAHGVHLSIEQATELLRDALGVEVEINAALRLPEPMPDAELTALWDAGVFTALRRTEAETLRRVREANR